MQPIVEEQSPESNLSAFLFLACEWEQEDRDVQERVFQPSFAFLRLLGTDASSKEKGECVCV